MIITLPTVGVYLTVITMAVLKASLRQETPSILQENIIVQLRQITSPLHEVFLYSNWLRMWVFPSEVFEVLHDNHHPPKTILLNIPTGGQLELGYYPRKSVRSVPAVILAFGSHKKSLQPVDIGPSKRECLDTLRLEGHVVYTFGFRGCGRSTGYNTSSTIEQDTKLIGKYIAHQHPDSPIIVYGWSVGGSYAASFADMHPEQTSALILDQTFTSLEEVVQERVHRTTGVKNAPSRMIKPILSLSGIQIENRKKVQRLQNIGKITLAIHSPNDEIIPQSTCFKNACGGWGHLQGHIPCIGCKDIQNFILEHAAHICKETRRSSSEERSPSRSFP